jgi:hypothetical protein
MLTQSIDNTSDVIVKQMFAEAKDKGIEIKVDGQNLFYAPGADQQFTNKYLVPLNNSLKVYAKLLNKDISEIDFAKGQETIDKKLDQPSTETEQPVETTPTEEVTTAPVEPETPIKETSAKELNLDFVINELGPKESQQGHRDKAGKLIKSPKGALGQFQILPSTAEDPGFNLPSIDLETSTVMEQAQWVQNYLDKLVSYYRGDKEKALAAYNYGYKNVDKLVEANGGDWKTKLPAETKDYLQSLL